VRAPSSFDYAVLRLVPRVERQEFINVGVILFCLQENFLGARVQWSPDRLRAFAHELDLGDIKRHLEAYPKICDGIEDSGPIGRLTRRERFHWLVAPRSTIIQVSSVHSGICTEPASVLQKLFERLVL
jgi:Protein of unknown function (DUF3037)